MKLRLKKSLLISTVLLTLSGVGAGAVNADASHTTTNQYRQVLHMGGMTLEQDPITKGAPAQVMTMGSPKSTTSNGSKRAKQSSSTPKTLDPSKAPVYPVYSAKKSSNSNNSKSQSKNKNLDQTLGLPTPDKKVNDELKNVKGQPFNLRYHNYRLIGDINYKVFNNHYYLGNDALGYFDVGTVQKNGNLQLSKAGIPLYNILEVYNARTCMASYFVSQHQYENADIMLHGSSNYSKENGSMIYWCQYYVNQFRKQHNLKPLAVDPRIQLIADLRAIQCTQAYATQPKQYSQEQQAGEDTNGENWIHGMDKHETVMDDMTAMMLQPHGDPMDPGFHREEENAGPILVGKVHKRDGNYHYVVHNDTTKDVAYNSIYDMTHFDKYSHNGHAKNLLSDQVHYMGVSLKFDPNVTYPNGNQYKGAIVYDFF